MYKTEQSKLHTKQIAKVRRFGFGGEEDSDSDSDSNSTIICWQSPFIDKGWTHLKRKTASKIRARYTVYYQFNDYHYNQCYLINIETYSCVSPKLKKQTKKTEWCLCPPMLMQDQKSDQGHHPY